MQRTIFISIYDGDTEKNILRSGILPRLKQAGHRIVLLIRGKARLEHYKTNFADETTVVELLPYATTFAEHIWFHLSWNSVPTHSVYLRRRMRFEMHRRYIRYALESLAWFLARFRLWRAFLRRIYFVVPDDYGGYLFDTYKPDLLFAPNMFSPEDFRLMRNAKKRGIRTLATAKSWDVLTTKAFTRVKADRLLVFNEFNRREAISLGDYNAEQVVITGFPQFDVYVNGGVGAERSAFFTKLGLDPEKALIFFSIPGDWKTPHTKDILVELSKRIDDGRFVRPIQILAQIHPKYPSNCEGLSIPHVHIRRPGTLLATRRETSIDMGIAGSYAFTFTDKDVAELYDVVRHSEICINIESTLTLDAAAAGKPSILIGYDGNQKVSYWRSVARLYERDHYQNVVRTGGAPLVMSHDELEKEINAFLADPAYLRRERENLERDLLYRRDGRSSERVATAVLAMLEESLDRTHPIRDE